MILAKLYMIIVLSAFTPCSNDDSPCALDLGVCEPKTNIRFTLSRDSAIRALVEDEAIVYVFGVRRGPTRIIVRQLHKAAPKYEVNEKKIKVEGWDKP